jgi:hypothetical protein
MTAKKLPVKATKAPATKAPAKKPLAKVFDVRDWRVRIVDAAEPTARAGQTAHQSMLVLLIERYGVCKLEAAPKELNADGTRADVGGPSKTDYDADQKFFGELAKLRGLANNQWVRKPYASAVKALYGTLPVNESAEALRKRLERKANGASTGHGNAEEAQAGRKTGETQERAPSKAETAEQFVTRTGIPETMDAMARVLETKPSTALAAKVLRSLAEEMRGGPPVEVKLNTRARKAA